MKTAICLFGICYCENYKHWGNRIVTIDYRKSLENYKKRLFSKILKYDIYISTYNHNKINNMIQDYNPEAVYISDDNIITGLGKNNIIQKNILIYAFKNLFGSKKYDNYIFTRFDLIFNFNITDIIYNIDSVNVLAQLEKPNLICDNFYIISHNMLDFFMECMKNNYRYDRHNILFFKGKENIYFLTNEKGKMVPNLDCYKINRK